LRVTLIRNEDDYEMLSFSFLFTELDEMYDYNLYLLYQAMANVPLTKLGDIEIVEESDRWRNKWLYLRGNIDYVVSTHMIIPNLDVHSDFRYRIYDPDNPTDNQWMDNVFGTGLGFTAGLELQFLYWMSAEVDFIFRFGDPENAFVFIPGIGLQLKFPLKPARHFMLEPYIMGAAQMNTSSEYKFFPRYAAGGGMQFGAKGGEMGAFFVDANILYSLADVVMPNPRASDNWLPPEIRYTRIVVSVGIGYKVGFLDRPRR
jgi:hypothetical protein